VTDRNIRRLRRRALLLGDLGGWAVMLPGVILFAFFVWVPLISGIRMSVFKTEGMRITEFTGLYNYQYMVRHPDFLPAVRNTFLYTFWSLIIGFMVPIALSVLVNESSRGKSLFRTSIYLPNMVPGLATMFIWRFLFKNDFSGGINMLLSKLGLQEPLRFLSSPVSTTVICVIVLTMTWKSAGATALIYLAGLQGINPELYEAAIIDGAGCWQRIRHITVPQLYNLARTLLILQIIAVFQILYEPMVMTNGGPNNASVSLMQLVYRQAFEYGDYSKASAVSVLVSAVLIILTLVYLKISKPKDV
jgi:multiple sugar transport system permease protein